LQTSFFWIWNWQFWCRWSFVRRKFLFVFDLFTCYVCLFYSCLFLFFYTKKKVLELLSFSRSNGKTMWDRISFLWRINYRPKRKKFVLVSFNFTEYRFEILRKNEMKMEWNGKRDCLFLVFMFVFDLRNRFCYFFL